MKPATHRLTMINEEGGVGYVNKSLTLKLPSFLKAEPLSNVVRHSVVLVRK